MLERDATKNDMDVLDPSEQEGRLREQVKKLYRQLEGMDLEFQNKEEALKQAVGLLTVLSRLSVEQDVRPLLDQLNREVRNGATPPRLTSLISDIKGKFAQETVWDLDDDVAFISESVPDGEASLTALSRPAPRLPQVNEQKAGSARQRETERIVSPRAVAASAPTAQDEREIEEKLRVVFYALLEQLQVEGQKGLYDKVTATKAALSGDGLLRRLSDVRLQFADLLEQYQKIHAGERERLEEVLRELIGKLVEIEKKVVVELLANHQETMADNAQFADRLEGQMVGMHEVAQLKNLDAVRSAIVNRAERMRAAIQAKREADQALSSAFEEKVHTLEQQLRDANQQLSSMTTRAYHDAFLEGVYNRLAFNEKLQQEVARFVRYRVAVSLLLFDMDRFKQVNDTYGHQAGDLALQMLVSWVKPTLREPDVFARFGGDEFALILPNTSLAGALIVAERLRTLVSDSRFLYEAHEIRVSLSMGVASARTGDSAETLLSRADQALYLAKEKGRNQVRGEDELLSSYTSAQASAIDKMVGFLSRKLPFRKEKDA
jgi:diguanylate cyclase (GGDEF)-like protein